MLDIHHIRMKPCFVWWIWLFTSFYCNDLTNNTTNAYFVNSFQHGVPFVVIPTNCKYLPRSEWKSPITTYDSKSRSRSATNRKTTISSSISTTLSMMFDPDIVLQLPAVLSSETAASSFLSIIQTFVSSTIPVGAMDSSIVSTTITSSSSSISSMSVSPEPIHTAFTIATFLPQPFWALMVLFPNSSITKRCMTGYQIPLLCSGIHLLIVIASILINGSDTTAPLSEINDVFDINGDPQRAFFHMTSSYPDFVAEEWSHVLTWDLFVGRYIWYDAIQKKINASIPVLFCNLIGPIGLLMYWVTCKLNGQPFLSDGDNLE